MVLSLRGDGVFPPSLQYTRGGKRTRTAMRHTGWPPMADREEPSGPENPTPPPSHRKVRVVKSSEKGVNGANFGGDNTVASSCLLLLVPEPPRAREWRRLRTRATTDNSRCTQTTSKSARGGSSGYPQALFCGAEKHPRASHGAIRWR